MVWQGPFPKTSHSSCDGLPVVQSLDYNVPGGKLNRGIAVVDTVEILKGRPLTEEEYLKAAVLGWCVELVSIEENNYECWAERCATASSILSRIGRHDG